MIRNWSYLNEYRAHREEILRIVDEVFSSGRLILGKHLESFERNFASFCNAPHAVGVNSGTDALFLALKALGIGYGDEIITVANTAVPTVAAIRATGALPVFIDVEEDSFLMDTGLIERAVTDRTRCILPVHLYGQPSDIAEILDIAASHSLMVVEDCAQAAGAEYMGRKVGSLGDIGAFSFYPTKVLGGFGDAGMTITAHDDYFKKIRRLRFYGMEDSYYSLEEGYNSRLDEVHAALLDYRLSHIDEALKKRRRIAELYSEGLSSVGDIILPLIKKGRTHQFYAYTIRTSRRDALMLFLQEHGIETRIHYAIPIHLMQGYRFLGYRKGDLPVTERLSGTILSLPMFPDLSDDEIYTIINSIRTFFEKTPDNESR